MIVYMCILYIFIKMTLVLVWGKLIRDYSGISLSLNAQLPGNSFVF